MAKHTVEPFIVIPKRRDFPVEASQFLNKCATIRPLQMQSVQCLTIAVAIVVGGQAECDGNGAPVWQGHIGFRLTAFTEQGDRYIAGDAAIIGFGLDWPFRCHDYQRQTHGRDHRVYSRILPAQSRKLAFAEPTWQGKSGGIERGQDGKVSARIVAEIVPGERRVVAFLIGIARLQFPDTVVCRSPLLWGRGGRGFRSAHPVGVLPP